MSIELVDKKAIKLSDSDLKTFLATKRVVIVDSGKTVGRSLRKFLMQYGAKADETIICEVLADARREVASKPTHLLITDLSLLTELVSLQEEPFPNRAEIATIVLSPDPSSSSVGMIAESNADALLVKPFNFATFKEALDQALVNKIKPSPYWSAVERGKSFFKEGKLDDALTIFESVKALDPKPTLGFYYVAQIREKKGDLPAASAAYEEGLKFDPKDYRCLLGSFDAAMKAAKYPRAYELATQFHAIYPVSTLRIPELVRLSVHVKRFGDIQDYAKIFKNLEQKDPLLSRVVIAGMLVCAKYFYIRGERPLSAEMMKSAAIAGTESKILLPEIVRYFAETENADEGIRFVDQLPEEELKNPNLQFSRLELLHLQGDGNSILKFGMELARARTTTPRLYELLLTHSKKAGRTGDALAKLLAEAKEAYPAHEKTFDRAVEG